MHIEDLVWFAAVAKMGSISAAASSLGISQPTLSKAVARLEHSTRTQLLERQARGVRLTPYGQVLHQHAQRLDLTMSDMMAELRDLRHGKGGSLRWGVGAGVANDWVVDACTALHADGIALEVVGGNTDFLMQELLSGSVDLLLLGAPGSVAAPAKWQRLMSDPMVPLAPLSHPIHAQNKLTLTHLAQAQWLLPGPHTFTRKDFDACFERADIAPPHPALCSRSSMRDVALAQTLGLLLLLPQSIADLPQVRQDFRALRMPSQWRSRRELGFAWRADGYQNPVVKRCIKLVQQSARAHKQQA